MGIPQNLKRFRLAAELSQEELAERAGLGSSGQSRIANYESTGKSYREPSPTVLAALARALGVTVSDIVGDAREASELDWSDVRGYAQATGLGNGVEAQEYAETHKLKFRADSLSRKRLNPRQLAVMYGSGDSMLPRIQSGDAILFDQSDTRPRDEALFVIALDGAGQSEYSVKRCRYFGDMVFFDALNPEGDHNWRKPRRMDDPRQPIQIIGRVRWIGSWEG